MNRSPSTPSEFSAYLQKWECMITQHCFKATMPDTFHSHQYRDRLLNPTNGVPEKMGSTVQETSAKPPQGPESNGTVQYISCHKLGHISCDFPHLKIPVKCIFCDSDQHTRVRCPLVANHSKSPLTEPSRANLQVVLFHSIPL